MVKCLVQYFRIHNVIFLAAQRDQRKDEGIESWSRKQSQRNVGKIEGSCQGLLERFVGQAQRRQETIHWRSRDGRIQPQGYVQKDQEDGN